MKIKILENQAKKIHESSITACNETNFKEAQPGYYLYTQ